jgi:hypothetical protein
MPSLYTEIEINAPSAQVWQALLHKEQWRWWNTFLFDCDPKQEFQPGQEVWLSIRRLPGEEEIEFYPTVTVVQPLICLQWQSKIPGLCNEHSFELLDSGRDRTKYVHRERFSGWLTQIFLPLIRQDEQKGMRRMAMELKQYVETLR